MASRLKQTNISLRPRLLQKVAKAAMSSSKVPDNVPKHAVSRTLARSFPQLMPMLKPTFHVLDVGCGFGSITLDFGDHVAKAIGIDSSEAAIDFAKKSSKEPQHKNKLVEFKVANVYELPFPDNSFDVVHTRMVLIHIPEPIRAMREIFRVLKPGGFLASREGDIETYLAYPINPFLDNWKIVLEKSWRTTGAEPRGGGMLAFWAREAGFDRDKIDFEPIVILHSERVDAEEKKEFGYGMAKLLSAPLGTIALEKGFVTREEINKIADAWQAWAEDPDALYYMVQGQMFAYK